MKISINAYSVSCTRNNVNLCYIHLYLLDVSISVLLKSSSFCLCTLLVKCNDEEQDSQCVLKQRGYFCTMMGKQALAEPDV